MRSAKASDKSSISRAEPICMMLLVSALVGSQPKFLRAVTPTPTNNSSHPARNRRAERCPPIRLCSASTTATTEKHKPVALTRRASRA